VNLRWLVRIWQIAQARELPAADRGGTSDPFVQVKVGKHQAKTEVLPTARPNPPKLDQSLTCFKTFKT